MWQHESESDCHYSLGPNQAEQLSLIATKKGKKTKELNSWISPPSMVIKIKPNKKKMTC